STASSIGTTTPAADNQSSQRPITDSMRGAIARAVNPAMPSTPAASRTGPSTVSNPDPVVIPAAVIGTPATTSSAAVELSVANRPRSRSATTASAAINVAAKPA